MADSWNALLPGIGQREQDARQRFIEALQEKAGRSRAVGTETVSYVTPRGQRVREQIVVRDGRAIVFCHIYSVVDDLFVGWDAHLNLGEWAEQRIYKGINRADGKSVIVNTAVPGVANPNEYDLIDLNGLSDWVHHTLGVVVRQLVAENNLDLELDFSIIRGERRSLLDDGAKQSEKKKRQFKTV
jgi:hypothetical protein